MSYSCSRYLLCPLIRKGTDIPQLPAAGQTSTMVEGSNSITPVGGAASATTGSSAQSTTTSRSSRAQSTTTSSANSAQSAASSSATATNGVADVGMSWVLAGAGLVAIGMI